MKLCLLDHASTGRVDRQSNRIVAGGTVRTEMVIMVATTPIVVAVSLPVVERPFESRRDVVGAGRSGQRLGDEQGQHHRKHDEALVEPDHDLPHLNCQRAGVLLRELILFSRQGSNAKSLKENRTNSRQSRC